MPVGKYNPVTTQIACLDCEIGLYQDQSGIVDGCKACEMGRYADVEALSICKDCIAGKRMQNKGVHFCSNCEIGRFSDQTGQSRCKVCPAGTLCAIPGVAEPQGCGVGSYAYFDILGEVTTCYDCLAGQYQNEIGKEACKLCLPGLFTTEVKQTICKSYFFFPLQLLFYIIF